MFNNYFLNFWQKSVNFSCLSFSEKLIFFILVSLEIIYKILFFIIQKIKILFHPPAKTNFKVISIGNISVGGTGKSALTRTVVSNLESKYLGGIISRGYKSLTHKNKSNILIDQNNNSLLGVETIGDEPFMLSKLLKVPIAVGPNRIKSAQFLENYFIKKNLKLNYVILDDGYQNNQLVKDFEILILDARLPFGNNHCLPAGPLREKDISRASCIVFSHSDYLTEIEIMNLKQNVNSLGFNKQIFLAKHEPNQIIDIKGNKYNLKDFENKFMLPFAGIGSFDQFLDKLAKLKINTINPIQFKDHYEYSPNDLSAILDSFIRSKAFGLITTFKDLYKILSIIKNEDDWSKLFVLDISFEFLTAQDHMEFFKLLENCLNT